LEGGWPSSRMPFEGKLLWKRKFPSCFIEAAVRWKKFENGNERLGRPLQ